MKQNRLFCLLLAASLTMLCGCAKTAESTDPDTTTTVAATTATTASAATTTEPTGTTTETAPTADDNRTAFTFDTIQFSFVFPDSWEGAYATANTSRGVVFYELQNHLYNARGKLFSIVFVDENDYREGMYPEYEDLGIQDGKHVIWLDVTDVQYEPDLEAPYHALAEDLNAVRSSFQLA